MRPDVLIVADDLSGAAETAAELVGGSTGVPLALTDGPAASSPLPEQGSASVRAVDTDTRHSTAEQGRERTRRALASAGAGTLVFAKLDSLLRGNPRAVVAELQRTGRAVVLSAAHPRAGRTVRAGVSFVDGVALHETSAWAAEPAAPPRSVAEALGTPALVVPLDAVRSASMLAEALATSAAAGAVAVCDAETLADLSAVAEAALALPGPPALAGTAALARALAQSIGQNSPGLAPPVPERPILVVAGTRAPSLGSQFSALASSGASVVEFGRRDLSRTGADPLAGALGDAPTAVRLGAGHDWRAVDVDRLAQAVAPSARATGAHLVLTGGETARRVLEAIGIEALTVIGPLGGGAVLCLTADGRAVVTRPGAFGDDGHLVQLTARLRALMTETAAVAARKESR